MVKNVSALTIEEYNNEVATGKTVVKFFADWCGPCNMLKPVFAGLSKEIEGVNFLEVNIDDNKELTDRYGVKSIPTMVLIKDGEVVDQNTGFLPKEKLTDFLNKLN